MTDLNDTGKKSFWSRPEGTTGALFILGGLGLLGYAIYTYSGFLLGLIQTTLGLALTLGVLGILIYMILDKRTRTLFSYMYQSIMRKITSK